jgi:hypothetical protein
MLAGIFGISPPANPTTTALPSQFKERIPASRKSPPTASIKTSTPPNEHELTKELATYEIQQLP